MNILQKEPINLTNTTPSARIIQVQDAMLELTESLTNLKAYPNPATDYMTFEYKMPQFVETAELLITDLTGKVIRTQKIQQNEGQYLWDTRQVQNGLYLYVLKDRKGSSLASGKISILK